MSCCNGGTSRSTRTAGVRRPPPKPTAKRTWTVTYTESGQEHIQEFTGGRAQELAAHRLSAQKHGSIRMAVTRLKPESVASEVTLSVPAREQAPTGKPEESQPEPVANKTTAKKITKKKAVAAK